MRLVLAAGRLLENSGRCSMIQQKNKEKREMEKTEKYPTPKMKKKKKSPDEVIRGQNKSRRNIMTYVIRVLSYKTPTNNHQNFT